MDEVEAPGLEEGGRAKSDDEVGREGRETSLGMFLLCGEVEMG